MGDKEKQKNAERKARKEGAKLDKRAREEQEHEELRKKLQAEEEK
jgi:hypothetical protein